jgi:hypothetical protein
MKGLFSKWLKRQCGVIDDAGTNRLNYLIMKVDYLSEKVVTLETEKKQLMSDIISLENTQSDYESELGNLERLIESLSNDVESGNFNYIWEKLDDVYEDVKSMEVPTMEDIRYIVGQEMENTPDESSLFDTEEEVQLDKGHTGAVNTDVVESMIDAKIQQFADSLEVEVSAKLNINK